MFSSECDAEVVLRAWGRWGPGSVDRLHAVRGGLVGNAGVESAMSGPVIAAQCVGDCIAVVVGRGRGEFGI